jgi:multiple sugar transport system permease protein
VTLPLLSPAVFFVVVTSIINSFQVFDQALVMTALPNGIPELRAGLRAAQSIVLFACIAVITAMQFLLQRRQVHYDN